MGPFPWNLLTPGAGCTLMSAAVGLDLPTWRLLVKGGGGEGSSDPLWSLQSRVAVEERGAAGTGGSAAGLRIRVVNVTMVLLRVRRE